MISPEIMITADGSHTLLHPILKLQHKFVYGDLSIHSVLARTHRVYYYRHQAEIVY